MPWTSCYYELVLHKTVVPQTLRFQQNNLKLAKTVIAKNQPNATISLTATIQVDLRSLTPPVVEELEDFVADAGSKTLHQQNPPVLRRLKVSAIAKQ